MTKRESKPSADAEPTIEPAQVATHDRRPAQPSKRPSKSTHDAALERQRARERAARDDQ